LSSGTEHPRINVTDILNLRVPLPNLETQEKIIIDIKEMEDENNKRISEIKALRKKIDTSINEVLKELSDMINV
jgi:restriction endonuclease S subunit